MTLCLVIVLVDVIDARTLQIFGVFRGFRNAFWTGVSFFL